MTQRTRWLGLLVFVIVCLGAGGLGAIATTPEIEGWYEANLEPALSRVRFGVDDTLHHDGDCCLAGLETGGIQTGIAAARTVCHAAPLESRLIVNILCPAPARLGVR